MTRRVVYGISLWVYLGAAACTIAAIALPNWVSYTSPTDNDPINVSYGLHKRCSSITGLCTPFPQDQDCHGDDRSFCSMWRSTGFLMNFSVIFELAVLVAYIVILFGGRCTREVGWKILSPLLLIVAAVQLVAMTLVVCYPRTCDLAALDVTTDTLPRPTFTTTTTASSSAGLWTSLGFSARSAGLSCCSTVRALSLQRSCFHLKTTMRLFPSLASSTAFNMRTSRRHFVSRHKAYMERS